MITPENQQVPDVLDRMTTPGMASRVILELLKMLLKRVNTTTRHATISEFTATSGGALNPSLRRVGLTVVTDDGKEHYCLIVDFLQTCIANNAIGADSPAALSDLYDKLSIYFICPYKAPDEVGYYYPLTCRQAQERINGGAV